MEKKNYAGGLIAAMVGIIAIAVVAGQSKSPVLRLIVDKQDEIIKTQGRIESALSLMNQGALGITGGGDAKLAAVVARQEILERRITQLENDVKTKLAAAPAPTPSQPPQEDFSVIHEIPAAHTPIIGKKDAPVTIVEFVDFECPFCSRFHPPVAQVAEEMPDKVNYMLKSFPLSFHPNARPAAKAAFAAGEQGKYAEMAEQLLHNFRALSSAKFEEIAGEIGLDVEKFKKDLTNNDAKYEQWILEDMQLGSKVGVRGTPTFYINGRKTRARDVASLKQEIEEILSGK